ncbi:MAG TPA: hypothetical protein VK157_06985 [Phycisphaerales bacterium]|nr:hypothetical protein [Phycisphaerales bacterium]
MLKGVIMRQRATWFRGRMLPGLVLAAMFSMGCYTLPSQVRVVNLSSQTLEVTGNHSEGVRMVSTIPPKGEVTLNVDAHGSFTGNIQAGEQRWEAQRDSSLNVCFVDDPQGNGRLAMIPIERDPIRYYSGDTRAARENEYFVINRTQSTAVFIPKLGRPARLLLPGQVTVASMPSDGDATFRIIVGGKGTDVTLPRDGDRVWIIRE